jgi:UDP-glucuronate 4-epimerase
LETTLVTGGAGFIGSHLCEHLLHKGHKVINIDSYDEFYNVETKRKHVEDTLQLLRQLGLPEENYVPYSVDIRDQHMLEKIFQAHDIHNVVHLAGCAGVRPSIDDPVKYYDVNVTGTLKLLEVMKLHKVTKMIFASSSSVYGNNTKVPFSEQDAVDFPISPYAASKKSGELLGYTYHHLHDINIACLRFFTVYGPRQRPDLAIHKFAKLIMAGQAIPFFGEGDSSRDYTYIDDIIDGIYKAMLWVQPDEKRYGVFNIGGSSPISLNNMVAALEKAIGKKANLQKLPIQPGDVDITYADISKSEQVLGYNPKTPFAEGIEKFIEWLKAQK